MKIMILGGVWREHALAYSLVKSPRVTDLFCVPGNAGTASLGTNLEADLNNLDGLVELARAHAIDLTVVRPGSTFVRGCGGPVPGGRSAHLRAYRGGGADRG